jgi:cyclophilin family peptidyl-prolyl cis-trans isomerase
VSKAAKRERQRLNRDAQRQYRETLARRRRRLRLARNLAIVAVPVAALIIVLNLSGSAPAEPKRDFKAAPAMTIDQNKSYTATMVTSMGTIVIDLDAKSAPTSVNNFVFLARRHFYDGLAFHRAVKDFVIQGGDPKGNGQGGPGYSVAGETPVNGYKTGSVAWAKSGAEPDGTGGSQFFIVLSDDGATRLGGPPYQYGLIGQVVSGLDVAKEIGALAPKDAGGASGDGPPTKKVTIESIKIAESPAAVTTTTTKAP